MRCRISLVVMGVLAAAISSADEGSIIDRCAQEATDAARIACLEGAIRDLTGYTETEDVQLGVANADALADATEVVADVEVKPEEIEASAPASGDSPATESVVDFATPESEPAAATAIGQEQVDAKTRTREEHLSELEQARGLQVERFEYVGYRKLQVRLANGQIWRQIRGDVQEIRVNVGRNPTVDIAESSLGGYRLRLNEIRRTIRVRRVR